MNRSDMIWYSVRFQGESLVSERWGFNDNHCGLPQEDSEEEEVPLQGVEFGSSVGWDEWEMGATSKWMVYSGEIPAKFGWFKEVPAFQEHPMSHFGSCGVWRHQTGNTVKTRTRGDDQRWHWDVYSNPKPNKKGLVSFIAKICPGIFLTSIFFRITMEIQSHMYKYIYVHPCIIIPQQIQIWKSRSILYP